MSKVDLVKMAMLATIRYPWEQGVCMQAVYELGDITTAIAMAHDAVLRQTKDGRFSVICDNIAVTDPAANGEVVYRAYEITGQNKYLDAAEKMYRFLMDSAPRTIKNVLCHNEVSFHEEYSADQIWVDSIYMAPPFLAVMGNLDEAIMQLDGMISYLKDDETGLLYHIYDAGTGRFVHKKLWATGNGWALLGIARVLECAIQLEKAEIINHLGKLGTDLLDNMLRYQSEDGRFHDILDEEDTFLEGTSSMMVATFIYRGIIQGWLARDYQKFADKVYQVMDSYVDPYGIIHEVSGCPNFVSEGTSAESMAAYLMMHAWRDKLDDSDVLNNSIY